MKQKKSHSLRRTAKDPLAMLASASPGHSLLKLEMKEKWFQFFAPDMGVDIAGMGSRRDCSAVGAGVELELLLGAPSTAKGAASASRRLVGSKSSVTDLGCLPSPSHHYMLQGAWSSCLVPSSVLGEVLVNSLCLTRNTL